MSIDNALILDVAVTGAAAAIVAVAGLVGYWLHTRKQFHECRKQLKGFGSDLNKLQHSLTSLMSSMERSMVKIEQSISAQEKEAAVLPQPVGQSINLTRRARALSMKRRGEDEHMIAASLNIPAGELDLLLKVDRLMTEFAEPNPVYR